MLQKSIASVDAQKTALLDSLYRDAIKNEAKTAWWACDQNIEYLLNLPEMKEKFIQETKRSELFNADHSLKQFSENFVKEYTLKDEKNEFVQDLLLNKFSAMQAEERKAIELAKAEEKARIEAEKKARIAAEEKRKAQIAAEEKARIEAEKKARIAAEEKRKAQIAAEEKRKAQIAAEEKAQIAAEEKAQREAQTKLLIQVPKGGAGEEQEANVEVQAVVDGKEYWRASVNTIIHLVDYSRGDQLEDHRNIAKNPPLYNDLSSSRHFANFMIGDMHGNPLKLICTIWEFGLIDQNKMTCDDVKALLGIIIKYTYSKDEVNGLLDHLAQLGTTHLMVPEEILKVKSLWACKVDSEKYGELLEKIHVNPNLKKHAILTLKGDLLSDRYPASDSIIKSLLNHLKYGIFEQMDVVDSNHDGYDHVGVEKGKMARTDGNYISQHISGLLAQQERLSFEDYLVECTDGQFREGQNAKNAEGKLMLEQIEKKYNDTILPKMKSVIILPTVLNEQYMFGSHAGLNKSLWEQIWSKFIILYPDYNGISDMPEQAHKFSEVAQAVYFKKCMKIKDQKDLRWNPIGQSERFQSFGLTRESQSFTPFSEAMEIANIDNKEQFLLKIVYFLGAHKQIGKDGRLMRDDDQSIILCGHEFNGAKNNANAYCLDGYRGYYSYEQGTFNDYGYGQSNLILLSGELTENDREIYGEAAKAYQKSIIDLLPQDAQKIVFMHFLMLRGINTTLGLDYDKHEEGGFVKTQEIAIMLGMHDYYKRGSRYDASIVREGRAMRREGGC